MTRANLGLYVKFMSANENDVLLPGSLKKVLVKNRGEIQSSGLYKGQALEFSSFVITAVKWARTEIDLFLQLQEIEKVIIQLDRMGPTEKRMSIEFVYDYQGYWDFNCETMALLVGKNLDLNITWKCIA